MNTSLEHLPEHKQHQLKEITEIIVKAAVNLTMMVVEEEKYFQKQMLMGTLSRIRSMTFGPEFLARIEGLKGL